MHNQHTIDSETGYFSALQIMKASFLDGNERDAIVQKITETIKPGEISILDIGIGDGRAASKIARTLTRLGYTVSLTGIDPLSDSERMITEIYPSIKFFRTTLEGFKSNEQFDVVIATQSLYYTADPAMAVKKMLDLTKKGGLSLVVLWSRECAVSKLFRPCRECRMFYEHGNPITIENLYNSLPKNLGAEGLDMSYSRGRIYLSAWKNVPGIIPYACAVFSRTPSITYRRAREQAGHIRLLLQHFNDIEERRNGILTLKK